MSIHHTNETSTVADADAPFVEVDFFATPLDHAGQAAYGNGPFVEVDFFATPLDHAGQAAYGN